MNGANWLKIIIMSSGDITGEHLQSLEYLVQKVVLSLIWLHSLVCQIRNKQMWQMSQLVAYSGNICVELLYVMNVAVDS